MTEMEIASAAASKLSGARYREKLLDDLWQVMWDFRDVYMNMDKPEHEQYWQDIKTLMSELEIELNKGY